MVQDEVHQDHGSRSEAQGEISSPSRRGALPAAGRIAGSMHVQYGYEVQSKWEMNDGNAYKQGCLQWRHEQQSKNLNSTMFDAMFFTFMCKKGLCTAKTNATSAALKGCGNVGLPWTSSAKKCANVQADSVVTMQFQPMKNIILRQPLPLVYDVHAKGVNSSGAEKR